VLVVLGVELVLVVVGELVLVVLGVELVLVVVGELVLVVFVAEVSPNYLKTVGDSA